MGDFDNAAAQWARLRQHDYVGQHSVPGLHPNGAAQIIADGSSRSSARVHTNKRVPQGPAHANEKCARLHRGSQAAQWWSSKMRQHDLAASEVQAFETAVRNALTKKCDGHWYPSDPLRGSGYRSLVNDISTDPIFLHAAAEVRIRDIGSRLPRAVMWVNPCSVKVQLENGRYPETVYSMCNSGSN